MFNHNEFEFLENVLLFVNLMEDKFDDQVTINSVIIVYINN